MRRRSRTHTRTRRARSRKISSRDAAGIRDALRRGPPRRGRRGRGRSRASGRRAGRARRSRGPGPTVARTAGRGAPTSPTSSSSRATPRSTTRSASRRCGCVASCSASSVASTAPISPRSSRTGPRPARDSRRLRSHDERVAELEERRDLAITRRDRAAGALRGGAARRGGAVRGGGDPRSCTSLAMPGAWIGVEVHGRCSRGRRRGRGHAAARREPGRTARAAGQGGVGWRAVPGPAGGAGRGRRDRARRRPLGRSCSTRSMPGSAARRAPRWGGPWPSLAADTQVLCVTHLAQVAACARTQVVVRKGDHGGRTVASAEVVGGEERVTELSRMLAGDEESDHARRHAEELLARHRGRPDEAHRSGGSDDRRSGGRRRAVDAGPRTW